MEKNNLNSDEWYDKGLESIKLGQFEEAINCFDKVLEIDPQKIIAWHDKASALRNLGNYEMEIECYNRILDIDPDNESAKQTKNIILKQIQEKEKSDSLSDPVGDE